MVHWAAEGEGALRGVVPVGGARFQEPPVPHAEAPKRGQDHSAPRQGGEGERVPQHTADGGVRTDVRDGRVEVRELAPALKALRALHRRWHPPVGVVTDAELTRDRGLPPRVVGVVARPHGGRILTHTKRALDHGVDADHTEVVPVLKVLSGARTPQAGLAHALPLARRVLRRVAKLVRRVDDSRRDAVDLRYAFAKEEVPPAKCASGSVASLILPFHSQKLGRRPCATCSRSAFNIPLLPPRAAWRPRGPPAGSMAALPPPWGPSCRRHRRLDANAFDRRHGHVWPRLERAHGRHAQLPRRGMVGVSDARRRVEATQNAIELALVVAPRRVRDSDTVAHSATNAIVAVVRRRNNMPVLKSRITNSGSRSRRMKFSSTETRTSAR